MKVVSKIVQFEFGTVECGVDHKLVVVYAILSLHEEGTEARGMRHMSFTPNQNPKLWLAVMSYTN